MIDPILCPDRPEDRDELQKWVRKDKTARMTIGLTLSDEMLEKLVTLRRLSRCGKKFSMSINATHFSTN